MSSIYGRTSDLFDTEQSSGKRCVRMRLERYGCWYRISDWMEPREAELMLFALRRRVADFALSVRRSKAKLAEVVALEGRR